MFCQSFLAVERKTYHLTQTLTILTVSIKCVYKKMMQNVASRNAIFKLITIMRFLIYDIITFRRILFKCE